MSDLYDTIENIRKRPSMYLGHTSIANLRTFLAGYCFARRQAGITQTQQEKQFSEFQSWIQQRLNLPADRTWDRVISFCSEDENSAWEKFFQLFEEFKQIDRPISVPPNSTELTFR